MCVLFRGAGDGDGARRSLSVGKCEGVPCPVADALAIECRFRGEACVSVCMVTAIVCNASTGAENRLFARGIGVSIENS